MGIRNQREKLASISASCRYSKSKKRFLTLLKLDLHRIGISGRLRQHERKLEFEASPHLLKPAKALELMKQECRRRLHNEKQFIQKMEKRGIFRNLGDGKTLEPNRIKPRLQFCKSREDRELFRFFSMIQSIPAPNLLYRQIAVLVRDDGHKNSPVMGILGLSSSLYSLGCRDRYFGWTGPENRGLKNRGLDSCMQLSICMALPPYSYLRAGRLIAALAASNLVASEFSRRYFKRKKNVQLRAIVTTCASGLHTPIFNRIMLCRGGLYRRIGQTAGYSTVFFSKATLAAARKLIEEQVGKCPSTTDRAIRTLKRSLNICNIPREHLLRLGTPKGVYLAVGSYKSIDYLRGLSDTAQPTWPSVEQILSYWKVRDLSKALVRKACVRNMRAFRPEQFLEGLLA